jgi:hypothetical protein
VRAALGAAIVAAHALGFAALAARCHRPALVVELAAPPAAPAPALDAAVPAGLADRIAITDDPAGAAPGLHHRTWTVRYRGGIERAVGAAQLVGPFQPPGAARCTGRIVVGQRLLDDGHAGPGTIAAAMRATLEAELAGETIFPIGALHRIDHLALRWARLDAHPEDRALVGAAPTGYVRASATVVFDRVAVPIVVALIPEPAPGALRFRTAARAALAFDNRAVQWVSDKLGADALATRLARRQLDDALITALAPPPPFPLSGGQTLRFTYCDEPVEIVDGGYAALPFGVAIERDPRDPRILPPALGHGPRPAPRATTTLALDLDLDALNALLYELWRGGWLDRQLATAGLDRRFNADPTVRQFLSLRLSPPTLRLPPVVSAVPGGLRLAAEARLAIHDGATTTAGRAWGALTFQLAAASPSPSRSAPGAARSITEVAVDLGELALSCERTPTTLVPCYGDLVAAIRGRSREFHAALTQAFTQLLSDIFVGRLTATSVPVDLVIHDASPSVTASAGNASVHLELAGAVYPPR